jgi:hypothetical protein
MESKTLQDTNYFIKNLLTYDKLHWWARIANFFMNGAISYHIDKYNNEVHMRYINDKLNKLDDKIDLLLSKTN